MQAHPYFFSSLVGPLTKLFPLPSKLFPLLRLLLTLHISTGRLGLEEATLLPLCPTCLYMSHKFVIVIRCLSPRSAVN